MGGAFQALCPLVSRAHKLAEVEAAAHMLHPHDLRHVDGVEGQGPGGLLPGLGVDKAVEGTIPSSPIRRTARRPASVRPA